MTNSNLNIFKSINLAEYACKKHYYSSVPSKITHAWAFLESANDKILIRKKGGYYFFSSIDNPSDKGSIIDFIKNRTDLNFGEIREELENYHFDC